MNRHGHPMCVHFVHVVQRTLNETGSIKRAPWSKSPFEKYIVAELTKKFLVFYGVQRLIACSQESPLHPVLRNRIGLHFTPSLRPPTVIFLFFHLDIQP